MNNVIKDDSFILINTKNIHTDYNLVYSNIYDSTDEKYAKFFLDTINNTKELSNTENLNQISSDNKIKNTNTAEETLNYIKQHIIQNSIIGLSITANQTPGTVFNLV